jgi:hypothetical protein
MKEGISLMNSKIMVLLSLVAMPVFVDAAENKSEVTKVMVSSIEFAALQGESNTIELTLFAGIGKGYYQMSRYRGELQSDGKFNFEDNPKDCLNDDNDNQVLKEYLSNDAYGSKKYKKLLQDLMQKNLLHDIKIRVAYIWKWRTIKVNNIRVGRGDELNFLRGDLSNEEIIKAVEHIGSCQKELSQMPEKYKEVCMKQCLKDFYKIVPKSNP